MALQAYDRAAAVAYARKWALSRNPRYYDYEDLGGDCTNFGFAVPVYGQRRDEL